MKLYKGVLLLIVVVLLVGCGKTSGSMTAEKIIQESAVILMVDNQSILADETVWRLSDTKIQTHTGTKTTIDDLKVGDLISYVNDGAIAESYPQQGSLKKITVLNDEYSLRVSSAITSFLENQPKGDLVKFEILSINESELNARMKVWDFEVDGRYLAQIDLETHEFTITEE